MPGKHAVFFLKNIQDKTDHIVSAEVRGAISCFHYYLFSCALQQFFSPFLVSFLSGPLKCANS